MAQLPPVSNVFGYLRSNVGLRPIASTLCSRLGLTVAEIWVERSSIDDIETLHLETLNCSLETSPARAPDTWSFTGAVAGTPEEIFGTLLPIVQNLGWAGFSATFEIYDATFQFAGQCPREGHAR
jgi:hypothetical protein